MSGSAPDTSRQRPSVEDVATLLRARTKDAEGREVGTFNEDTRPTAEDVETHIDAAMGLVGVRFPGDIPDEFGPAFASLVAYRAAMRIEKSYFPEQVRSERSPYEELRQEYVDDLQALVDAMEGATDDPWGTPGRRAWSEPTPTFLRVYGSGWGWWDSPFPPGFDHWPEPENPANWQNPFQPPREPPLPEDLPVGDEPASGWPA